MWRLLIVMILAGLTACTNNPQSSMEEDSPVSVLQSEPVVMADQLQIPWSISKVEDTFYLSERSGSIVKIEAGEKLRQKVELEGPLSGAAEAGLLGFVLHPDFSRNKQAFAYYTYDQNGSPLNRVVTLTFEDEVWRESKVLLDRIPSGPVHHGGRLKIGPDEKLYITAGDAAVPENAQNLETLAGKILRMNLDGSVPSDNPFANSYIYSFGHRNPQGLVWDASGQLYASEHGQSAHDEINRIEAGANYGWPIIQGDEKEQDMMAPIFHTGEVTWAPSGIAYHNGRLYVASLRGQALQEIDLQTLKVREIITGLGRIRDVMVEGDYLYFVSNNTDGRGISGPDDDKLYQIRLSDIK